MVKHLTFPTETGVRLNMLHALMSDMSNHNTLTIYTPRQNTCQITVFQGKNILCEVVLFRHCDLAFVTGFAKRGLPHTSNSINLEDHNLVFKKDASLKFSPSINLCWCSPMTKFQVNNCFQSQVMNCQSS